MPNVMAAIPVDPHNVVHRSEPTETAHLTKFWVLWAPMPTAAIVRNDRIPPHLLIYRQVCRL